MNLLDEIIKERQKKFLGYIEREQLKHLERLLNTDLGVYTKNRQKRPFIAWYDWFGKLKVVFLTLSTNEKSVNLRLCKKENSECNESLEDVSYVFYDRTRKKYAGYTFKGEIFEYVYCGYCENLQFLENLNFYSI